MKFLFLMLLLGIGLFGCTHQDGESNKPDTATHASHEGKHAHNRANQDMNSNPFESMVQNFDSPERDEWQQPEKVLSYLGDLSGKTVMDIGSGSGYFSFKFHQAGAKVICADVDERFLGYIAQKRDSLGIDATEMETRKIPYDSSTLQEGEADLVVIVDTYHHIDDRPAYFSEIRERLKPGGELIVIDFFKKELPVGPGVDHKVSKEVVMEELEQAGYTTLTLNTELLPYQFVVRAGV